MPTCRCIDFHMTVTVYSIPMQTYQPIPAKSMIAKRLWLALPAHCRSALPF